MTQLLVNSYDAGNAAPRCTVTRLTPPRRGAVAVVSVEGPDAVHCVAQHFSAIAGKPLQHFPLAGIVFGHWQHSEAAGEEVVVCRLSENRIEMNCHGGVAAAQAISNSLVAVGAVEQRTEEWINRHATDGLQAEAQLALMQARTERVAVILLDQFRGVLREAIESTIDDLNHGRTDAATSRLQRLISVGRVGLHLTDPWRIVFAGPPNVGKSSLINRLLGYRRSIVYDEPGTTRDLLAAATALDGWPVELVDSAGLRASNDEIEIEGVTRTAEMLDRADVVVLVFDATSKWDKSHQRVLTDKPDALAVMNKSDLQAEPPGQQQFLCTSAVTGAGIDRLISRIVEMMVYMPIARHEAIPFTTRQIDAIQSAGNAIEQGNPNDASESLQSLLGK